MSDPRLTREGARLDELQDYARTETPEAEAERALRRLRRGRLRRALAALLRRR